MEEVNPFRADLHSHTSCSDGSDTPEQLITQAINQGLGGLAITDHDNCNGYATALPAAKKQGLQLISGIEFSSVHAGLSVHILGYAFALNDPGIQALSTKHLQRRRQRNNAILELLAQQGMAFSAADLAEMGQGMIGRPHIAKLMVQKGYVPDLQRAFARYIGDGCSCYVKGENISPEETIAVIQQAKGFAVIAHPHLITQNKVVDALLAMNFDGIECYYSQFQRTHQQRWLDIAKKKQWLITGGSDYHGTIKPKVKLGCSWVGLEHFTPLKERFEANCR